MNNLTEEQIQEAAERAYDTNWWENHDNIVITAEWMAEEYYSASDLAYLIAKPWKFSAEYAQARHEIDEEDAKHEAEKVARDLVRMERSMSVDSFLDGLMAGGSTNMVDDR